MPSFKSLTGKVRKARRAAVKRRQAQMPKTMKATGRRQTMKKAKEGIAAAGKRFAAGWVQAGGPTIKFGDKKSGAGVARTLNLFGGQAAGVTNMPAMDTPQKVNTPNSATLSYLSKQINHLAEVAANIGAITREQQDALREQIKDANRIAKEQQMESAATAAPVADTGSAIEPGRDTVVEFYEALAKLTEIIEDKVREQQDNTAGGRFLDFFSNRMGLGKFREARKAAAKQPKLRKGIEYNERLNRYVDKKTGRTVKEVDALKNLKTVDPSNLKTRAGLVAQAEAVSKPGLVKRGIGSATAKLTNVMGKGTQRAKNLKGAALAGGKVTKDAISRIATPIVKSALTKTAITSIPLIGLAAGGLFAIGRLLQGDVVGAGLDAASGLGGPLTAVPALVASLARDVYISAFNTNPETDPMFGQRMGMVNDAVTGIVKSQLGEKITTAEDKPIQPQQSASGAPALKTKAPPPPGDQQAQQTSSPPIASTTSSTSTASGSGSSSSESGGATSTDGASSNAPSSDVSSSGSSGATPATSAPVTSSPTPGAAPIPESAPTKKLEGEEGTAPAEGAAPSIKSQVGEKLLNASAAEPQTAPSITTTGQPAPKPSFNPTTRPGAKGMGDVPDPGYSDLGSFADQLYFGAAVGAMA